MSASSASLRPSLLLLLLALLVAMCSHMAVSQTCDPGCRGPPGRDGRDGPPGTSSPMAHQDYVSIRTELEQELKVKILSEIEESSQKAKGGECVAGLGKSEDNPASSCRAVFLCNEQSESGQYWIRYEEDKKIVTRCIYCNMEDTKCGIQGGWMRVAHIDTTSNESTCPSPLRTIESPRRVCARSTADGPGCSSVTFSTCGLPYTRVCGRTIGYQFYSTDAFNPKANGIEGAYVDGLSITHGQRPRKHIWTYASGLSENHNYPAYNCPCALIPGPSAPDFVGEHFHCESGNVGPYETSQWYPEDPLFDGKGCDAGSSCCSASGLPYFCRTLPCETTDDIEARWCSDETIAGEDVATELLEIYVM